MPSKPLSKASNQSEEVNFVLKNRIAGAGFLLFFGALVLPWLLGPPSEAVKLSEQPSVVNQQVSVVADITSQQDLELKNTTPEQEQVYISKITPLDRTAKGQSNTAANDKSDGGQKSSDSSAVQQIADQSSRSTDTPKQGSSKTVQAIAKAEASNDKSKDSTSIDIPIKGTAADKPAVAKPAEAISAAPTVDVGWAVQVGVFTDKRGAAKVVDDLRDKGFNPSTSIVDTNRGKATGTRIWLGPYAQRVEAAKAKSLLTSKTGEAGFIRAYP